VQTIWEFLEAQRGEGLPRGVHHGGVYGPPEMPRNSTRVEALLTLFVRLRN